ncbi:PDR/VanB family oxidoreductase [Cupriavidus basilensis]|uniref:Flavodoxin reductases (Ferredoxin-NADPH reductases) family 1 n=1 Tax=Cupriavidus basilensis TaxID=68895 RepID=A0A0C4YA31_9BURK|nr:PDR/VanB family oxidoreductase [Cupriavidus basilensis]AJG22337.1 Flavodoxin reductases (ferredoxin-NADPH reductases) family 1 [Cupriavidus basilensis]
MIDLKDVIPVRVVRKTVESEGIVSFELVHAEAGRLPSFAPGAHIDVHIPGGFVRQYSLCNAARKTGRYVVAVLRDPSSRGGSTALHDSVSEGDTLEISPPRNHFKLNGESVHSLLLAGGIGVTPIFCMAEQLYEEGRSFELHYCARNKQKMAFHDAMSQAAWSSSLRLHFDDGAPAQKFDIDSVLEGAGADTHLYVCGPQGYMDAVLDAARGMGWAQERLHYEYFKADVIHKDTDSDFEVEIASTGTVLSVPADRSIASVLNEHGFNISMSCEQGVCGTCVTKVLSGVPDHRDSFLLPDERDANDQMTPCCSRAKSKRIVLDL